MGNSPDWSTKLTAELGEQVPKTGVGVGGGCDGQRITGFPNARGTNIATIVMACRQ